MATKYPHPPFLVDIVDPLIYREWLKRKAVAHRRRDKGRGNATTTNEAYKVAIHAAVERSGGVDAYTGKPLCWDLISRYDNDDSKVGKRSYKQQFGDLPSVDHVGDGLSAPDFHICAWRTNDAKSDLSYDEFIELCRIVLVHEPKFRSSSA